MPIHAPGETTSGEHSSTTVLLNDEEGVKQILNDTIFGLWATVNNLSRLRPARRSRYRVTIFGSARIQPGHVVYEEVRNMTRALAEMGCDIVTGGGPGLMQAANEGADAADSRERVQSIGIGIELPAEQGLNPFVELAYEHQSFFTRLHQFVLMSDAYIVVPGGIGTVLESMMIWQLLQVRHLHDTPLVFVGDMWPGLVDWASRSMLRPEFELAGAEDMDIPQCVSGGDAAIAIVRENYDRWRSGQDAAA